MAHEFVKQDAKLTIVGQLYDISILNGDIETEDSFDTPIITSLFTEARAHHDEVVTPERRRGWIGSHNSSFILGSTMWVYGQLRNRQVELNELAGVARLALDHFKEDGRAINVSSSIAVEGNLARLSIRIERPNNRVDYRYYELWENTGV